jgi:hypothetical protein
MIFKIIGLLILVTMITGGYFYVTHSNFSFSPPQKITFETMSSLLPRSSLVKNLPEDSTIALNFYKESKTKIEHVYTLTKGKVTEKPAEKSDVAIFLPSKYVDDLTTANICSIITEAKNNGDLTVETSLSSPELAWKFKYLLLTEKDCLG